MLKKKRSPSALSSLTPMKRDVKAACLGQDVPQQCALSPRRLVGKQSDKKAPDESPKSQNATRGLPWSWHSLAKGSQEASRHTVPPLPACATAAGRWGSLGAAEMPPFLALK